MNYTDLNFNATETGVHTDLYEVNLVIVEELLDIYFNQKFNEYTFKYWPNFPGVRSYGAVGVGQPQIFDARQYVVFSFRSSQKRSQQQV